MTMLWRNRVGSGTVMMAFSVGLSLLAGCGAATDNSTSATSALISTTLPAPVQPAAPEDSTTPAPSRPAPSSSTTAETTPPTTNDISKNINPGGTDIFGEIWHDDDLSVLHALDNFFEVQQRIFADPTEDLQQLADLLTPGYGDRVVHRIAEDRNNNFVGAPKFRYRTLLVEWDSPTEVLVIICRLDEGTWGPPSSLGPQTPPEPSTGGVTLDRVNSTWLVSGVHSDRSEPCEL